MTTGLIYDDRFLLHDTGPDFPERPERLRAIVDKLKAMHLWDELHPLPFGPATREQIERLHDPAYVQRVFDTCERGAKYIDAWDSVVSKASAEVAQLAVGGVIAAVDAVMAKRVRNAICLVRPPGHHAEANWAMGFCLFANVALAAEHLVREHGLERVAILDFDVHHGNGTQHLFEHRSDVLFISMHEHPNFQYPGTGHEHEAGRDEGEGYTVNIPMAPRSDDAAYRHAMLTRVTPALEKFAPQFLLLSSGFDAGLDDPLGHMDVTPQGFQWMTRHLKKLAERLCNGRLVSTLEGGYNLRELAESVALHVDALLDDPDHDGFMNMKAGI